MAAYREPMKMNKERAGSPVSSQEPHSPWHSPVPYLFGGLAAMLGLIAFALLILACSYWKLSGYLEGENDRDLEAADQPQKPYEEKILVIMAGQDKPTFLATPSSMSSSFGNTTCTCQQIQQKSTVEVAGKQGNGTADTSTDQNR